MVRCRRRAGVGQAAADGLCRCEELPPMPQLLTELPSPPLPNDDDEELSDLSFLKAPSGPRREYMEISR